MNKDMRAALKRLTTEPWIIVAKPVASKLVQAGLCRFATVQTPEPHTGQAVSLTLKGRSHALRQTDSKDAGGSDEDVEGPSDGPEVSSGSPSDSERSDPA